MSDQITVTGAELESLVGKLEGLRGDLTPGEQGALDALVALAGDGLAALEPDLFTTERMYGDVETDGTLTYGATVFDRRRNPDNRPNMDVTVDMDASAVTDHIIRRLTQPA